jgi:c-di-GMP-binding flagellar brake protein YcgR
LSEIKGIQISQKIYVTNVESRDNWYLASVQDITDNELLISIPTKGTNPLVLKKDDHLIMSFTSDGSRYEFSTRVNGWRYDNIPMYVLTLPGEYKRVQLRQFVRISTLLDVLCAEMPESGKHPVFIKCSSLDISGGGIRLLHKKNFEVDTKLLLKIIIPVKKDPEYLELNGIVVRTWPDDNLNIFKVAVRFEGISRSQQDLIVRYTFMKMSEQRRFY